MESVPCSGGVVINDGKLIIVNQNHDSWSLPKGHIDPGETARQAATREIREESGITELNFVCTLGSYQRHKIALSGGDDTSELKQITVFLYTTHSTDLQPEDPANPIAKWVSLEEAIDLLTHPKDKEFLISQQAALAKHIQS